MKLVPQHYRIVGVFVLVLACAGMTQARAAGPAAPATDPITDAAETALWWGDFDELERQNAVLRQPGQLLPDASMKLELFRDGLDLVFNNNDGNAEPYLRELEALTLQWATEHPKSALAQVMYARVLWAHAWSYRGGGYVKDVPPDAWRDFNSYLHRAADYLRAHGDVAFTDSYAHLTLIGIGRGLEWPAEELDAIAHDGLKRNPEDTSLYFEMLTSLLPKWGGDPKALDDYIRKTAEETKAVYGMGMYARLYSAASDADFGHRLFQDSYADWGMMKKGYADMFARFPNSPVRKNQFAHMACLAKDRATLRTLLAELGPKVDAKQWGPNPERSLETCRSWAAEKDSLLDALIRKGT